MSIKFEAKAKWPKCNKITLCVGGTVRVDRVTREVRTTVRKAVAERWKDVDPNEIKLTFF